MPEEIALPDVSEKVVGGTHRDLEALLNALAKSASRGGKVTREPHLVGLTSRLPPGIGVGSWQYIQLSPHLILSLTDAEYHRDARIDIEGDDTFKVRVVLRGRIRDGAGGTPLQAPFVYVEAYPGKSADSYEILGGKIQMIVLHCRVGELTEGLGLDTMPMPEPISQLFTGSRSPLPSGNAVRIGAEVMRAATDIFAAIHQYPEPLLPPFLRAKAQEILCSVLRQLAAPTADSTAHGLRSRDVNRIYEARDIVLANLETPPSLAELSRAVGVCQTKLKAGFKAIFGATVFEYIRARQMERGLELLLGTDKSISEIAYEVGYRYPANFTHAFKRHFNYLPTQVRQSEDDAEDSAA
ncbi:MAG: AraC family transcriptional regulator [Pseudohaliea sp.]